MSQLVVDLQKSPVFDGSQWNLLRVISKKCKCVQQILCVTQAEVSSYVPLNTIWRMYLIIVSAGYSL